MAKGDSIAIMIRGADNPVMVIAEKAGRKLVLDTDKDMGLSWILVHEKTWTDKTVKTSKFAATDVVAIIDGRKDVDA